MINPTVIQQKLFTSIRIKYGNEKKIAEELGKLLGLGQSAIYKRLRGSVLLNLEELIIIARHFDISLDQIIHTDGHFSSFRFAALKKSPTSLENYLAIINDDILQLPLNGNVSIHYISNDLPIFYYFFSPELLSFKLFVWGRTIWEWKEFQGKKFVVEKMLEEFPILFEQQPALINYLQIRSIEFWKTTILDHFLHQIHYYSHNKIIEKKKDAILLCEELKKLNKKIRGMALRGSKILEHRNKESNKKIIKNFQLYQNEINNTNNVVLVSSEYFNKVYTTFNAPNFMTCDNEAQINYSEDWFERIEKYSRLISNSESNCIHFFDVLERKINGVISKIIKDEI